MEITIKGSAEEITELLRLLQESDDEDAEDEPVKDSDIFWRSILDTFD